MRCLGNDGRLLEIGKYDILKATPLSMRPMLRNVAFEGIDVDRFLHNPDNVQEVIRLRKTVAPHDDRRVQHLQEANCSAQVAMHQRRVDEKAMLVIMCDACKLL